MEYKNKVLFLRKSKAGKHLYAFNKDESLGGDVKSLIMNVTEIEQLLGGATEYVKVSVMREEEEFEGEE